MNILSAISERSFIFMCREYDDLANGQLILQDLVERLGIPVFSGIRPALECTAKVKTNISILNGSHLYRCLFMCAGMFWRLTITTEFLL